MVRRRRSTLQPFLSADEIEPEMLERLRLYFQRYYDYRRILPIPQNSTGNSWEAHAEARRELGLTSAEEALLKRVDCRDLFPEIEAAFLNRHTNTDGSE